MSWKERIERELESCAKFYDNQFWYRIIEKLTNILDEYPEESFKDALDLMLKSWNHKPWSSISLDSENFNSSTGRHYRAWYIQKHFKGIYNIKAYLLKIRRYYFVEKENKVCEIEESFPDKNEIIHEKLYISRGGIINGDYIHNCYLKHQTGKYSIKDPIKIPVSSIEFKDSPEVIFFVDHREPKLKALMEFYNVPIEHDDKIKFNVRTFKKLK